MDLKKAKLNDDAALYNREPEKTDKQKWKEMNGKQRLDFFNAYYLKPLLFILAGVIFFGFIIWNIVKPKATVLLEIAVNDFTYIDYATLDNKYLELNGYDTTDYAITADTAYSLQSDSTSIERFSVYAYSGDVDLLISGNTVYEHYATNGFLKPLDEILDADFLEYLTEKGLTYSTEVSKTDYDGSVIEVGETHVYGIYLDRIMDFVPYSYEGCRPIIGIVTNSENDEECINYIKYLFDNYYTENNQN